MARTIIYLPGLTDPDFEQSGDIVAHAIAAALERSQGQDTDEDTSEEEDKFILYVAETVETPSPTSP